MHFTKLHGLGNDFVTFDNRDGAIAEEKRMRSRRGCATGAQALAGMG